MAEQEVYAEGQNIYEELRCFSNNVRLFFSSQSEPNQSLELTFCFEFINPQLYFGPFPAAFYFSPKCAIAITDFIVLVLNALNARQVPLMH